jgi:hypothetical protein
VLQEKGMDPFVESPPQPALVRHTRQIRWAYLVPVIGAPIAHIFVSTMTKFPAHKKLLLTGVIVSTATMVANRLFLMADAGYPGGERQKHDRVIEKETTL